MSHEPTEMEMCCARQLYARMDTRLFEAGKLEKMTTWEAAPGQVQREYIAQVRAVISELRKFSTSDEWEMLMDAASPQDVPGAPVDN